MANTFTLSLSDMPASVGESPVETSEKVARLGDGYWPLQSWKVPLGGRHSPHQRL